MKGGGLGRATAPHSGRAAGGRPIRVPLGKATVRTLLRQHLREEGKRMQDLAGPWNCQKGNVYDLFWANRPLAPAYVDAAIEFLKLDAFDAAELRLLAAREAGWKIDLKHLISDKD